MGIDCPMGVTVLHSSQKENPFIFVRQCNRLDESGITPPIWGRDRLCADIEPDKYSILWIIRHTSNRHVSIGRIVSLKNLKTIVLIYANKKHFLKNIFSLDM